MEKSAGNALLRAWGGVKDLVGMHIKNSNYYLELNSRGKIIHMAP